jgi:type 1 glutamine amidotransferase
MFRLAALALAAAASVSAAPVRTLIVSGQNNHNWRVTTPYLAELLTASGRFEVRVNEEPSGLNATALTNYDLIVVDYQGPRWGPMAEQAVANFVSSGKGLAVVHGSSYAFSGLDILGPGHIRTGRTEPPWPEWAEMVGGTWAGNPAKTFHAPRHLFPVKFTEPNHPILRGLAAFETLDELYHGMRFLPGAHPIATAYDDPAIGGTGKNEPLLVTVNYGHGRVFYTALGHEKPGMQEAGFAITFVRGAEWAATGAVTLPPTFPAGRAARPLRVQVVTGGHEFNPEFYELFVHQPDLGVTITGHPEAYTHDFRKEVDVLVLYDMISEIGEDRRSNLRAFLEAGRGLVVLHHAIADFGSWLWWSEQVVGGKYLLQSEGGRPPSTYKHDEDLYVEAVGSHPITRGVAPLHFVDETYHGMWISPHVNVLLRTSNHLSDGPVAWIGPYDQSRVVYIELGHGRSAHENPDYQELIHRAILWSAGRLE